MILYHGSKDIIKKPIYHGGKSYNDYGHGFYCTENLESAKEWACSSVINNGYVNKYEIDLKEFNVLDLTDKKYSILNWIAILVKFRQFEISNDIAKASYNYLISNFYIDIEQYDVVIGYRADDAYFKFAKEFINNTISVEKLSKAMELGKLGKQVVLISELAHHKIKFIEAVNVNSSIYFYKKELRDKKARESYIKLTDDINGLFIRDIVLKGIKNGDKLY